MPEEYKPVPVAVAVAIAENFDKEMVVILAYDAVHQLTHTTTYGRTPQSKEIAADAGDRCTVELGAAIEAKRTHEDFRNRSEAEAAATIERLQGALDLIRKKLECVVCTKHPDDGVVLLSEHGPTTYDPELKIQVYDHDHFSPLGDALIELYELAGGKVE